MAALKKIGKTELNQIMKDLPAPVWEHCKRSKRFASYFIDRIKGEDLFLDAKLNPTYLIDAVSYHDIGKVTLPTDSLYYAHCNTAAKKKTYATHPAAGISTVENTLGVSLSEYSAKSFEHYLHIAVLLHHESAATLANGQREVYLIAQITAIVERFDNLLLVGKYDEVDLEAAIADLRALEGEVLDRQLTELFLSDREGLRRITDYVVSYDKNKRKGDEYGMRLYYSPVYDIREARVSEYRVQTWLNDPYYGMVKPATFLQVAEQSGQIVRFEKLAFQKLCYELDRLFEPEAPLPSVIFPCSAAQFEKKGFVKFLVKTADQYEVEHERILLALSEYQMANSDLDWTAITEELRHEGFGVVLDGFGDSSALLSRLDSLAVDRICMKAEYTARLSENSKTYSVVAGMVKIAYALHISVMFEGVENRATEGDLLRIKAKYATGALYGEPLSYKEFKEALDPTAATAQAEGNRGDAE